MRIDGQDPDPREEDSLVESLDDGDENEVEAAEGEEEELPPEDEEEQEAEPEPQPQARRGKSEEENAAALRRARNAEKERADRLERELAEARQQRQQPRNDGAEQAAEAARVAAMSTEERILYGVHKAIENHDRRQQIREFQFADANDQRDFRSLIDSRPALKKYEKEVEAVLQTVRQNGQNVSRQVILSKLIGDRVLANQGNTKQRKAAASNVQRNTVQPARNKSDLNGTRTLNERQAREKRLEGMKL